MTILTIEVILNIDTKNKIDSIIVPLFYYKGYKATFNKAIIPVDQSENGQLQLVIRGKGVINIDFLGTPIQKYSLYITLLSFILLFGYIFISNRKIKKS